MIGRKSSVWKLWFRSAAGLATLAISMFLGCGNLGEGCTPTGNANGNGAIDNSGDNLNGNEAGSGNDNVAIGNDNAATDNLNQNDNGDGTGGIDNSGGVDNATANQNENATDNVNSNTNANANSNTNVNSNTGTGNTNTNSGTGTTNTNSGGGGTTNTNSGGTGNTNTNSGGNTNTNTGPSTISTKSSGAGIPNEIIMLSVDDNLLTAGCKAAAVWTYNPVAGGPAVGFTDFAGTTNGENIGGEVFIRAPAALTTMDLSFSVSIAAASCGDIARSGSLTVQVQVANLSFTMPATIRLNTRLNLSTPTITIVDDEPVGSLVLYFVVDPLPPGVDVDLNLEISDMGVVEFFMEVTAGAAGQQFGVIARVVAQAGVLDEATDFIQISP